MNRSRLETRNAAKKISSRIFANSPGWIDRPGSRSQIFAPLIGGAITLGSTAGSASRNSPTRPNVYA
jgi:hypothetical protein